MKTLIANGRVITASQDFVADVLIVDDKIEAVGHAFDVTPDRILDATGCYVLPGGVDPHTHMEIPFGGTVASDDFETGTIAAAAGGTTTIIDFPIQERGHDPREAVEGWAKKAEGRASVDWGFHQIITDASSRFLPSLDGLVRDGITSFKLFTAYPGAFMLDDGAIFSVLRHAADSGAFIMFHCENGPAIDVLVKEALERHNTDPIYHARTRPSTAEGEATHRVIALARMAKVPIYVVHLSAKEALQEVRAARDEGEPVFAETCPHYLTLGEENLEEPEFEGAKYVCSPPLRTHDHTEDLWRGLSSGDLQVVSTDHGAFCFKGQKELGRGDFSKIPNGLPGVEWRLGLLHHYGVQQGRITLNQFVDLVSTMPAKLFGLFPRKGDIAAGSDADLVIFDPTRRHTLTVESQYTNVDYNPYEGRTLDGWPRDVLLSGKVVVENSKFVGVPGQGRFIPSSQSVSLR